jgi:ABC-type uncharacterized transport system involved in gliding motility auxiliary subunit
VNRNLLTVTGLIVAAIILVAVNVVANATLQNKQFDLTQDKLYTLSDGTKKVLSKIDEPVALKLYFSDKLAHEQTMLQGLRDYYERIRGLLQQYVKYSNGKVSLEMLDPEPFSEIEDHAVAAGLDGKTLPGTSDNFYFGLSGTGATDAEQVIPFFDPGAESTLEYDLTKMVYSLANPKKMTVGILSSLPIEGEAPNPFMRSREMPQPWFIVDQLRQSFETKTIQPNAKEIPKEVDVLLLIHPKNLPQPTLYAIDQFVLGGGRALVFVDPYCEADQPISDPSNPLSAMTASRGSSLDPLFAAWGVEMPKDKLAADRNSALRVNFTNNKGKPDASDYVVWLKLDKEHFNAQEVLTNQLKQLQMREPGFLEKAPNATTEFSPLIETSTDSMEVPVSTIQFTQDPHKLLTDFAPSGKKMTLAARITGQVKSAFPSGAPKDAEEDANKDKDHPEEKKDEPKADHLTESKGPIHVVVVADCDLLSDPTWVRVQNFGGTRLGLPFMDNGAFVLNTLDYMQGSTDMIGLRSRGGIARPFKVVAEIRKSAEKRLLAEEERLQGEYDKAEQRLQELQAKKQGSSTTMLSPEQVEEIKRIGQEKLATRKELRRVQLDLRKDVDNLGTLLQFLNIGLIPLMVVVFAVALWFAKNRRATAS